MSSLAASLIPNRSTPYALAQSLFKLLPQSIYRGIASRLHRPWNPDDFDIDPVTAFFPRRPLPSLPATFEIWEQALQEAPAILRLGTDKSPEAIALRERGTKWREEICSWPVLELDDLDEIPLLQRAHLVLASLVHFYAHSSPTTQSPEPIPIDIPRALSIPLMQVSDALGIAPVLTFADTVLWNWQPIDPARPLSIDNMRFGVLYSGTQDETNFYVSSAEAELLGADLINLIYNYTSLSDADAEEKTEDIAAWLADMQTVIEGISDAIQSVRQSVDPKVFYEVIRPWWIGSTTERPWNFEGVPPRKEFDVDGPSAGQSAIMHTLDVFLDIDHRHARSRELGKPVSGGFMDRMRRYMPRTQREFLERLAVDPRPIREYARARQGLREPYNNVVKALARLRDLHIRVATLYIVTQSKSGARCPFACRSGPAKGTGGNHVAQLLKASRDATKAAVIDA